MSSRLDEVINAFTGNICKNKGYPKSELYSIIAKYFYNDTTAFSIATGFVNKGIIQENRAITIHELPIRILMLGTKAQQREVSKKYFSYFCRLNPYFKDTMNELLKEYPEKWKDFNSIRENMLNIIEEFSK